MAKESDRPDDVDTTGKAVPPYEDRRGSADVGGKGESTQNGAKTGGATGPVEDDEMKAADPRKTPGGATGSPSDEQPAEKIVERRGDDEGTGPAHHRGTPRAEEQP
jgi:hypothetical protein